MNAIKNLEMRICMLWIRIGILIENKIYKPNLSLNQSNVF